MEKEIQVTLGVAQSIFTTALRYNAAQEAGVWGRQGIPCRHSHVPGVGVFYIHGGYIHAPYMCG